MRADGEKWEVIGLLLGESIRGVVFYRDKNGWDRRGNLCACGNLNHLNRHHCKQCGKSLK